MANNIPRPKEQFTHEVMDAFAEFLREKGELVGGVDPELSPKTDGRSSAERSADMVGAKPPPLPVFDGQLHPEAWQRVALPDRTRAALLGALHQYTHGKHLFEDWGLGEHIEYGRGTAILFHGPPGTGKTFCANVIARYLGAKLEMTDSGDLESCIPGQAERNIKAFCKKCADNKSVGMVDECDEMINSRDSAHMMEWKVGIINAWLRCLEANTGVLIFATNRIHSLDKAFNRRLSCKVEIPMPDENLRRILWSLHLPKKLPLGKDVSVTHLAKAPLSGGEIKNAVLEAARTASMIGAKRVGRMFFVAAIQSQLASREAFNSKERLT